MPKIDLKIIGSSSIGSILEWFEFSLFAFLTPMLARSFFPTNGHWTGLMLTLWFLQLVFSQDLLVPLCLGI